MRARVLILCVFAAGCAGNEAETRAPAETRATRADYTQTVNRICARNAAQVNRITAEAVDDAGRRGLRGLRARAHVVAATLPVLRRSFEAARRVPPPPAKARRARRLWRRADDSLALFAGMARAMRAGDTAGMRRARRRLEAVAADTRPAARALGLGACMA